MDENSSPLRESQESGSPSCPDRILDRKIERHGLGHSFSSNLARRGPSSGRKASDRSVRDMVGLFEKSTGTPTSDSPRYTRPTLEPGVEKDRRGGHDSNNNITPALRDQPRLGKTQTTKPSMLPSARIGYQVEDYSLTLLKHKSYFNNRPLARCLDENHEQDKRPRIQRVQSRKERVRESTTGDRQDRRYGKGEEQEENKDIAPPTNNQTASSIQQLDTLMGELLVWERKISESSTPELDQQRENRSQEEIESFWRSVRAQLGVDDEEIYGEMPRQAASRESVNEPEGGKGLDSKLSTSSSTLPASSHSDREPELPPPPMPTRPPPPIPTTPRGRSFSAAASQRTEDPIPLSWESFPGPARDSSIRLSISAPVSLDIVDLLSYAHRELPALPEPLRPPPATPTEPNHSHHPSGSGSSGHWIRPPTWRSPSSLSPSSPPPVPALPVPIPTAALPPTPHHRPNHSRHRHHQQPSKTSASTSTHSIAVTDSSGSRSMHSWRTAKTSTSSTGTRAGSSSTDLSVAAAGHLPSRAAPRRRLTTEEKLEEIDAFLLLSPGKREGGGKEEGWI